MVERIAANAELYGLVSRVGAASFAAAEWIRDNTDSEVKIACRKPYLMNAISLRRSTGYLWEGPDDVIADSREEGHRHRRRSALVSLHSRVSRSRREYKWMDRFEFLHIVPDPDTYILGFK